MNEQNINAEQDNISYHLSENQSVFDQIDKYLNGSDSDYAIMLSGDWGIGKTYFLRKYIYPLIQNDSQILKKINPNLVTKNNDIRKRKRPIYISLAGINTSSRLEELLKIQVEQFSINEKEKLSSHAKRLDLLVNNKINILVNQSILLDKNKDVLCFDDLERIHPDFMEQALNYLNTYIEHYGIKTIFICNENEIVRNEKLLLHNIAPKTINSNEVIVDFSEDKVDSSNQINEKREEERIEYKFALLRFNKIKEKYIRLTLYLNSQINELIENDNTEYIKNNKDTIKRIFEEEQSQNLRTWFSVKYYIEQVLFILEKIKTENHQEIKYIDKIKNDLIKKTCSILIQQKEPKTVYFVSEIDEKFFSSKVSLNFKSIILDLHKEKIASWVLEENENLKTREKDDQLRDLSNFIENPLQMEDPEDKLYNYINMLKKGDLNLDMTLRLFSCVVWLESFGINELVSVGDFKKGISKAKDKKKLRSIEYLDIYNTWQESDSFAKKYNELLDYVEIVNEDLKTKNGENKAQRFLDQIRDENVDSDQIRLNIGSSLDFIFTKLFASRLLEILQNVSVQRRTVVYDSFRSRYYNSDRLNPNIVQSSEASFILELANLTKEYTEEKKKQNELGINDIPFILLYNFLNKIISDYNFSDQKYNNI